MIRSFSIFIECTPIAKGRPRFVRRGKFVASYTPKKTKEYEQRLRTSLYDNIDNDDYMNPVYFGTHPVGVFLKFVLPIPTAGSKQDRLDKANNVIKHTKKPDVDNLAKAVLDAFNGVLWNDDSQIVELRVSKCYGICTGIYLSVEELQ